MLFTSRMALPTMRAAWNMVLAANRLSLSPSCRLVLRSFGQHADHGLGDGQIAGGEQHEDALARLRPSVELLELADIVDARIGPGVGGHDQALVKQQSHAIGHVESASSEIRSALLLCDLDADFNPHPFGIARPGASRGWGRRRRHRCPPPPGHNGRSGTWQLAGSKPTQPRSGTSASAQAWAAVEEAPVAGDQIARHIARGHADGCAPRR